jgi:hypothetical protein
MSFFSTTSADDVVDKEAFDALKKAKSEEEARKILKDLGVEDPMELTPAQRAAAERTKAERKTRALPTFDDVVREAMLNVTRDFDARKRFVERSDRLKVERVYDPLVMKQSHTSAMIRRQRQSTMLEQGRSITAAYLQASAFWVGSTTTALMTVVTIIVGFQAHKGVWGIVPLSSLFAWRSWEAYESVSEDLRFQYQAQEMRAAKRSHIPSNDALAEMLESTKEMSPLEKKRAKRKQQEEAAEAALARRREALSKQKKQDKLDAANSGDSGDAAASSPVPASPAAAPSLSGKNDMLKLNQSSGRAHLDEDDDEEDISGGRPMDKYLKAKSDGTAQEDRLRGAAERARKLAASS